MKGLCVGSSGDGEWCLGGVGGRGLSVEGVVRPQGKLFGVGT